MKASWTQDVLAIIANAVPALVREFLSNDNDSEQFRRLNELESRIEQLERKAKPEGATKAKPEGAA